MMMKGKQNTYIQTVQVGKKVNMKKDDWEIFKFRFKTRRLLNLSHLQDMLLIYKISDFEKTKRSIKNKKLIVAFSPLNALNFPQQWWFIAFSI